jgi:2-amino-4-hydroxy-6-hydroxymethyldihydropteridine diphosphokinase
VRAYLGLGGNIGEPAAAMAESLRLLNARDDVGVVAVSSLYRTPPWGVTDQPDFLNCVAALDTSLSARALLQACLDTERLLKRVRADRWGPRVIDIDVLLYGDQRVDEEGLQVPHPRMLQRAFVLAPLAEIAGDLDLDGQTVAQRLAAIDQQGIARLAGGQEWWIV